MNNVPKYYWDACIWIELITQSDQDKYTRCKYVLELAEAGKIEIWTSALTLAEVYKTKCEGKNASIPETGDKGFEDVIESEFIKIVSVNVDVGIVARRLLRKYPGLRKPQDAIHVATCVLNNIDEMHTFDDTDLSKFDGQMLRIDHAELRICPPPEPPQADDQQTELFHGDEEGSD